jgi:hypothetical protein
MTTFILFSKILKKKLMKRKERRGGERFIYFNNSQSKSARMLKISYLLELFFKINKLFSYIS